MRWEPELKSSSFFVLSSVGDGLRVCGHRGRAPLFASLPRRRSPRKARHRRLVLALRGVRLSGIPRPVGGRSPRSPWQGGRTISFPLALLLYRSRTFRGANSGHPAPISIKAAARVGRTAFRFLPALPGWGRGVLFQGAVASRWGLCEGSGGQCGAAFVAKHWPTGPKHRPQPAPAAAAWSRPQGRRNTA